MVSWFLTPAVALGAVTGLLTAIATTDPAKVAEPMQGNPMEAYQQICYTEAAHQGAPEAIAQGACRCLQQRLDALDRPPRALEDLHAFTKENRLACVFQAILEL
ncbi:MAG: hypothetical protein TQ37_08815 [Candidatus Synechococcus spongiarum 15L]|uniref:Uncharacterized protein n=2 Tax=Candidatus Synechococcus spongiarum TaxID=431041 RepID=A0A1T1CS23_9SYNE|nr:MAG: hypothetical protein TQ37_08815 [Candidatus Synechococcus spongiarum 15L]OOV31350.1 hypothetical protein BV61_04515 [Candidatus Synechococcus spongiarum LMB bulk15M]